MSRFRTQDRDAGGRPAGDTDGPAQESADLPGASAEAAVSGEPSPARPASPDETDATQPDGPDESQIDDPGTGLLGFGRRRLIIYCVVVVAFVIGLYVGLPAALDGLSETKDVIVDADPWWIAIALGFNVCSFGAYVALFRGVISGRDRDTVAQRLDWAASYQITMAGLAATRLFSAGGAGGIALTYWAVRRAGMSRRDAACRMVAFLVLLYAVYMTTLLVCGLFLRIGLFPGPSPVGMTIVPATLAGVAIAVFLLVSLIPQDVERRLADWSRGYRRRARWLRRLATGPATVASGTRTAMALVQHPSSGVLAIGGAIGFWATNIAVLWACFHAFGEAVPKAVLVQGFFVGMTANLLPFFPGGVGSVDAGMIAAFLAFGEPASAVIVSVLVYRVIAFWLPIPPGIVAYLQLRRTVSRWRAEELPARAGLNYQK
jgi:uncharacterized protein (TIRG00374 family)